MAVPRRIISIIPAVIIARSAAYPGQAACLPQRGPLFAETCFFQVKQGKTVLLRERHVPTEGIGEERERER